MGAFKYNAPFCRNDRITSINRYGEIIAHIRVQTVQHNPGWVRGVYKGLMEIYTIGRIARANGNTQIIGMRFPGDFEISLCGSFNPNVR
jgi:hypothetical protein